MKLRNAFYLLTFLLSAQALAHPTDTSLPTETEPSLPPENVYNCEVKPFVLLNDVDEQAIPSKTITIRSFGPNSVNFTIRGKKIAVAMQIGSHGGDPFGNSISSVYGLVLDRHINHGADYENAKEIATSSFYVIDQELPKKFSINFNDELHKIEPKIGALNIYVLCKHD